MTIIADFKARFPEFDTDKVDELLPSLESVYRCYYNCKYQDCDKEAVLNLLAHMFVEASTEGTAGVREAASERVGNVAVTFVGGSTAAANNRLWPYFGSTRYGRMFLLLINKNTGAHFV